VGEVTGKPSEELAPIPERALEPFFGAAPFELRFALQGDAAVRVLAPRGAVAPRHAEPAEVSAPWSVSARCGDAVGWLLADAAPARGDEAAQDALLRIVERRTALALQRLETQRAALAADLLETLTHRLRTDVSTFQAIAEGLLSGVFEGDDIAEIRVELQVVGTEAQRRLSLVREVMRALRQDVPRRREPVVDPLRAELDGAGLAVGVDVASAEQAMTVGAGGGWAVGARLLAASLAGDARFGGLAASVAVRPHPDGWEVIAGAPGATGEPVPWTRRSVGDLAHAGHLVAAAGGEASAMQVSGDGLRVRLALPAAPSG
jgi:hypothetical protein